MKSILDNPYRVIGILANASAKEIHARKAKISAFAKVGKAVDSEYDFRFLRPLERNSQTIDKAFSDIEQNQDKVKNALFWFVNANPIDASAMQYLVNGDKEKAIEIWAKVSEAKELTSRNFSAFNNLATLYLCSQNKEDIEKGIIAKIKLIESDCFEDFVHLVADETFSIDANKQTEILVDELLIALKNDYSLSETMALFGQSGTYAQKYVAKKFTQAPVHHIEKQIEQCQEKRKNNKSNAHKFGAELYNHTAKDLQAIALVLGPKNLQYTMLADNIAKEILQCSTDYFNAVEKDATDENYIAVSIKLSEHAAKVAVGESIKEKIKQDLEDLEERKDGALRTSILFLEYIKETYAKNEADIMKIVRSMPTTSGQSVNWTKVNNMIANSLDWDKIVELTKEAISQNQINQIKQSSNATMLAKYKDLVGFLFTKLSYRQQNSLKYLKYWECSEKPVKSESSIDKPKSTFFIGIILLGVIIIWNIYVASPTIAIILCIAIAVYFIRKKNLPTFTISSSKKLMLVSIGKTLIYGIVSAIIGGIIDGVTGAITLGLTTISCWICYYFTCRLKSFLSYAIPLALFLAVGFSIWGVTAGIILAIIVVITIIGVEAP